MPASYSSTPTRAIISLEMADGTVDIFSCNVANMEMERSFDMIDVTTRGEYGVQRAAGLQRATITIETSGPMTSETRERVEETIKRKRTSSPWLDRETKRKFDL